MIHLTGGLVPVAADIAMRLLIVLSLHLGHQLRSFRLQYTTAHKNKG